MVAVLQPLKQGKIIAIDRAVVLIGRSSDCDNVINGSQKISRRHCCLVQVDEDYYVRDLGSMNGVWLNGDRVNRDAKMVAGDKLSIGDVEFLFHPNARIEPKKNIATPPDSGAAPAKPAPPVAGAAPAAAAAAAVERSSDDGVPEDELAAIGQSISDLNDEDPRDDVIPLDELELEEQLQFETNEYEVIDEPIDDENDGLRDDIVMFDDDDE